MAITVKAVLDERATLILWCPVCRRHQVVVSPQGSLRLPPDMPLTALQARTRCRACRAAGEVWLSLPWGELWDKRRGMLFTWNVRPFSDR